MKSSVKPSFLGRAILSHKIDYYTSLYICIGMTDSMNLIKIMAVASICYKKNEIIKTIIILSTISKYGKDAIKVDL